MVGKSAEDAISLHDFVTSPEDDLPTLPHEHDGKAMTHPALGRRLWSLMNAAGCNVLPPLAAKPDSALLDELELLSSESRHWRVGGVPLNERLWTRSGPYWRGEVARTLAAGPRASAQGFLLMLAKSVTPRALLSGHGAPLVVRDGIKGQIAAEGPHLALIACLLEPTGQAVASHGFTQPVVNARCLMPIDSAFERDVLLVLIELQVVLDMHGVDCAITRPFDEKSQAFSQKLQLHFGFEGALHHELEIEISDGRHAARSSVAGSFILSPSELGDGRFLDWLEIQIRTKLKALEA